MAKKFGKFLLGATVIGAAAAAAAYYYYQKKDDDAISLDDEYEDEFEDEDEDEAEDTSYVSLGKAAATDEKIFTPLSETAKKVEDAVEEAAETVEEFFDEEDALDATEIDDSEDD
jgi:hypothetical protein